MPRPSRFVRVVLCVVLSVLSVTGCERRSVCHGSAATLLRLCMPPSLCCVSCALTLTPPKFPSALDHAQRNAFVLHASVSCPVPAGPYPDLCGGGRARGPAAGLGAAPPQVDRLQARRQAAGRLGHVGAGAPAPHRRAPPPSLPRSSALPSRLYSSVCPCMCVFARVRVAALCVCVCACACAGGWRPTHTPIPLPLILAPFRSASCG
jgi:hypothetical protein